MSEWTTIRLREGTRKELEERIDAKNMDRRIQKLMNLSHSEIEEIVEEKIEELRRR